MSKSVHLTPLVVGKRALGAALTTCLAAALMSATATDVYAKGGTAKPPSPKTAVAPYIVPTPPDPTFSAATTDIHQFDITGIIQDASVPAACAGADTMLVNGVSITIPANLIVQFPANTTNWCSAINVVAAGASAGSGHPSLTVVGGTPYGAIEAHVVGNIVAGKYIAALIYLSQQSLNSGAGVITAINYADGSFTVSGAPGGIPARLVINDPKGRYGRAQSADDRFSVDDQNPTIKAASGYPMCIPRSDPATADDPLCPMKNRPKAPNCRNFSQAGIAPPVSGELFPPAAGQVYCTSFVMKAVPGATVAPGLPALQPFQIASDPVNDPDARQQVPFEVGDYITYSGTLIHTPAAAASTDYISVHTIEANVSVFTQSGTQPAYVAMADFGIGSADPNLVAVSGLPQEVKDRIFLEALTTDVKIPVDIFLVDTVDPSTGTYPLLTTPQNRWVTPYEMTGECNPATALAATCYGYTGGITTQNAGPNPQRARIRATRAITGLLSAPSRNIRVMQRSFCTLVGAPAGSVRPYDQAAVDACVQKALDDAQLNPQLHANGLAAGQYQAPVFEFIFPEGTKAGTPLVPNDLWHLPFLQFGEGAAAPGGATGKLNPTPW